MGDFIDTDFLLSKRLFSELMHQLEDDWKSAVDSDICFKIKKFATIFLTGFLCDLQGEEVMKIDIVGLMKYIDVGAQNKEYPHVVIPLFGCLKGETGDRYHYLIMARLAKSGFPAGKMDQSSSHVVGETKKEE